MTSFSPDLMCLTLWVGFCCSMALSKLMAMVATLTNWSLTNCSCRQPGSSICTILLTVSTPSTHLSSTTMVSKAKRVSSRVDEEGAPSLAPPGETLLALTRSQRVSVGQENVIKPGPSSAHCEQSNTEIASLSNSSQLRSAPSCSTSKSLRPVVSTSSDHSASSSLISSTSSLTTELLITAPVSSSVLFASTIGSLSNSAVGSGSTSASGRSGISPSEMSLTLSRTLSSTMGGGVADFPAGCWWTGLRQPLLLLRA